MEVHEHRKPVSYSDTHLRRVDWSKDLATVRRRFEEYRKWLADHRGTSARDAPRATKGLAEVDRQIAELPGAYGTPRGDVVLAFARGALVACGALREFSPKVGEIKRIYVRADHRGPEFGPRLTRAVLRRARALGYERVRVDTLPSMTAAIEFYQAMGFRRVRAYWPHPVPGALFFEYRIPRPTGRGRARPGPKLPRA